MGLFFTADQHFGHANIIRFCDRPFTDPDHMREVLVSRWNEVVSAEDTVWVLGDWAMGNVQETLQVHSRLNGKKALVVGNHDKCFPGRRGFEKFQQLYLDHGFDSIVDSAKMVLADQEVLVSHWPYVGDSHDGDRFEAFRPKDTGSWLLHGHVHEKWRQRGRMVNVGVDAWAGYPVSVDRLADLMAVATSLPALSW